MSTRSRLSVHGIIMIVLQLRFPAAVSRDAANDILVALDAAGFEIVRKPTP